MDESKPAQEVSVDAHLEDSSLSATSIASNLESVVLSHEDDSKGLRDQLSFFHSIEEGNAHLLEILLKHHTIDINAYNDQGMTGLHLAVYKYETRRRLDILEILLKHGANVCMKAATPPQASKLSIVRHDSKSPSNILLETKRISLDQKTPLLLALELKSALYLRGWEYRHWDPVLKLLAEATWQHLSGKGVHEKALGPGIPSFVQKGWNDVFQSGKHDLVQVCAEGTELTALKVLLCGASKKLKLNLESMAALRLNTLELKDTSFNIVKVMVKFIYTGVVEPHTMEHKGIEILQASHKYGVEPLKDICEVQVKPSQENWIKLLTTAIETNSDVLMLKCARSIDDVMSKRQEGTHILKKSFSECGHTAPNQLFNPSH